MNQTKQSPPLLRGVIFDLDGTLVDSRLDFDLMRSEIGIPGDHPVLEFVEALPDGPLRQEAFAVLERHEYRGAQVATVIRGVPELLTKLQSYGLNLGILTRNLIGPTQLVLRKFFQDHAFTVITREDGPAKPDPAGLRTICANWRCETHEALFIGDYLFDVQAGRNAAMKTVLFSCEDALPAYAVDADHVTADFLEFAENFEAHASNALGFQLPPRRS